MGTVSREVAERRLRAWIAAYPGDGRAMFHLAKIREENVLVEKAAALGEARAVGALCSVRSSDESVFQLARAEGTYWLWHCFRNGIGCEKNLDFAEDLFERAVDLGIFNCVF